MKQRIYIDTSVVGGFFDKEFETETKALFERLKNKECIFVVSSVLQKELLGAPQYVRELLNNYDTNSLEYVELTPEAIELAKDYLAAEVVGKASLEDCQHIAIATLNKVDVLASWNFKHIVNLDRIKGYNAVNLKNGHSILEIRNPKDLIHYENS
ncbi:hypothetical protein FACS1894199_14300 [Bacteroidia bacterium]|nr:hypothetical protein FACS1894199_14300 [Bacteroidia bacterium]